MNYINFYHGRKDAYEDMEDWGYEGPIVGPLNIQWTYGWVKLWTGNEMHHLVVYNDLVPVGEDFYGDFAVIDENSISEQEKKEVISLKEFISINKAEEPEILQDVDNNTYSG